MVYENLPEIFEFVSKMNQNKKPISVRASVKSGKRFQERIERRDASIEKADKFKEAGLSNKGLVK